MTSFTFAASRRELFDYLLAAGAMAVHQSNK